MLNYMVLIATHLKWAFDLLLYHSFSVRSNSYNLNIPEIRYESEQELRVTKYEKKVKEGSEENEECAVCLCKIEEGEEIGELRCDHAFHRVCLERWFGFNKSCPLCRGSLAPQVLFQEADYDQLEVQVLAFKFCSFTSQDHRDNWWLR